LIKQVIYLWKIMIGNSMKPTLPFICLVNIQPQNKYSTGDIVAFKNNGRLFLSHYCHRIIKINKTSFTTKGDNIKNSDKYEIDVPIENIEGKIIIKGMV